VRKRCRHCGGTYQPFQADGSAYYHACPPDFVPFDAGRDRGAPAGATAAARLVEPRNENVRFVLDTREPSAPTVSSAGPINDGAGADVIP
jgi:hypothetical protein